MNCSLIQGANDTPQCNSLIGSMIRSASTLMVNCCVNNKLNVHQQQYFPTRILVFDIKWFFITNSFNIQGVKKPPQSKETAFAG